MTNRQFFKATMDAEFPRFMHVFEAVPSGKLDYRPHPRSRSTEELLGHLIGHEQDLAELAGTGKIHHRMQVPFKSLEHALELYRAAHEELEKKLSALDDRTWDETKGQFLLDGNVIYEVPYRDLGWMMLLDAVHHRGQLSTYLRPMGGKVPSIYGPSADSSGQ